MGMKKLNLKNNVRKYRVWKGWKQSDLANISGMSLPQIRLIEQQKCTPQMRNREKLCKVFNLSYNQLFFENETAETLGGLLNEDDILKEEYMKQIGLI
jgi:DNA-binding XRE family transcriptional regulator